MLLNLSESRTIRIIIFTITTFSSQHNATITTILRDNSGDFVKVPVIA
jgi:hypothetical protein